METPDHDVSCIRSGSATKSPPSTSVKVPPMIWVTSSAEHSRESRLSSAVLDLLFGHFVVC